MSDNIIERVARLVDPGAFPDWSGVEVWDESGRRPYVPSESTQARINYRRAQAVHRAEQVLALLVKVPSEMLRREFLDAEVEGWNALGLDHPSVREMVAAKHGLQP